MLNSIGLNAYRSANRQYTCIPAFRGEDRQVAPNEVVFDAEGDNVENLGTVKNDIIAREIADNYGGVGNNIEAKTAFNYGNVENSIIAEQTVFNKGLVLKNITAKTVKNNGVVAGNIEATEVVDNAGSVGGTITGEKVTLYENSKTLGPIIITNLSGKGELVIKDESVKIGDMITFFGAEKGIVKCPESMVESLKEKVVNGRIRGFETLKKVPNMIMDLSNTIN